MGVDEEGTLSALKELRRDLADPKIKEHRGRIVKTTGDGLLVEFASVVDAVRCGAPSRFNSRWRNATLECRKSGAFNFVSGSISATSLRMAVTSTVCVANGRLAVRYRLILPKPTEGSTGWNAIAHRSTPRRRGSRPRAAADDAVIDRLHRRAIEDDLRFITVTTSVERGTRSATQPAGRSGRARSSRAGPHSARSSRAVGCAPESQVRSGLPAGGRRIRTLGPRKRDLFSNSLIKWQRVRHTHTKLCDRRNHQVLDPARLNRETRQ
jgi:hypothetical protein